MDRDAIIARLRQEMPLLHAKFGVSGLLLFGSFARGDQHPDSDVDLLAEFDRPTSLYELAGLLVHLEEVIGRRVDVGPLDSLRPQIREEVLAEARRVA